VAVAQPQLALRAEFSAEPAALVAAFIFRLCSYFFNGMVSLRNFLAV
jgi:hypothetical protein